LVQIVQIDLQGAKKISPFNPEFLKRHLGYSPNRFPVRAVAEGGHGGYSVVPPRSGGHSNPPRLPHGWRACRVVAVRVAARALCALLMTAARALCALLMTESSRCPI